jgi:uncharacterized membrane protein
MCLCSHVRIKVIIIGLVLIVFAIPGYNMAPGLISQEMSALTGGETDTHVTASLLAQMKIPSIDTMSSIAQYSFVGLGVVGIGFMVFGAIAKKIQTPRFAIIEKDTESEEIVENRQDDNKAFHILQERLAKGEITSSQYQNLKKLLEEHAN